MRSLVGAVLVAGCYAPTVTPGAPCDPTVGNCPRPLQCVAGPTGFTCEKEGGIVPDDAAPDSAIDAASDAPDAPMIDAAPDAPAVTHVEYMSVVADCINPTNPNPDDCITDNGTGQMAVDGNDTSTGDPWDGYVRFDLDGVIAGRVVTSVKLRMTVTTDTQADAGSSGVVWQVVAFTRATLATTVPARVGTAPLAGSQGAVTQNQDVQWPLPTALPTASASVFLGISTASSDGANYWNQTNANRPRLIIDMAP